MTALFDIAALPAERAPQPAGRSAYSLEAFHDLLKRRGITLADVPRHPEASAFLRRRERVLAGTWPLYVYRQQHECDCDHCTQDELVLFWHCPCCGVELYSDDGDLGEGWEARCDREHSAEDPQVKGCGARFEARQAHGPWQLFAVPGTTDRTTYP